MCISIYYCRYQYHCASNLSKSLCLNLRFNLCVTCYSYLPAPFPGHMQAILASKVLKAMLRLILLPVNLIFWSCPLFAILQYAVALTNVKPAIGVYASIGSSGGVSNFFSGNLAAATSDDPMSVANDSLATQKFGGKFTFPIALTTYSFVTRKAKGLQISGAQMAGIYTGKITRWGQIKKGLRGVIVPVCRDSGSGTTQIITKWFNQYDNSIPVTQDILSVILKSKNSRLITATGSAGMAASTKNRNAIAYTQTGVGLSAVYKNFEVALQNPAGAFVLASNADPIQSIPRYTSQPEYTRLPLWKFFTPHCLSLQFCNSLNMFCRLLSGRIMWIFSHSVSNFLFDLHRSLPAAGSSWSAVSLVNANGQTTYPLASFEFTFVRQNYNGAFSGKIPVVQSFFRFVLSSQGQNLGKGSFFTPIPTKVNFGSVRALKRIKA